MVFPIAGGTQDTSYEIENSLRFNDDDSPYLSRTPSTATNNDKLTFSFWAKRSTPSANHKILTRYSSVDNRFYIGWANNDKLYIYQKVGGTESFNLQTTRLFRDPSGIILLLLMIQHKVQKLIELNYMLMEHKKLHFQIQVIRVKI